jgi:flagellar hook-length control protein FliK
MNATPSVSQAPIPSDPLQQGSAASADSVNPGAQSDFAAEMNNAGPKPARKAGEHKPVDTGSCGGQLPAPGNLSPALTAASGSGSAAASAKLSAPGASPVPGTGQPGAGQPGAGQPAAGAAAFPGAKPKVIDQAVGGEAPDPLTTAPADAAAGAGAPSGQYAAGAAAAGPVATPANTTRGNGAALGTDASVIGGGTAASSTAKQTAGAATNAAAATVAAKAAAIAATSGSSSNDGNAPTAANSAISNPDATSQAATAAAMSAATIGVVASAEAAFAGAADSPSSTDDMATPAGGITAQGAGAANVASLQAPLQASAIAITRPLAAAAATAAKAQALTTLANASAADKHTAGGGTDSPLTGSSGDSAAGAAQLSVISNSAIDATATATLKVTAGVDTPEFGQGLADRVSWMVDNNLNDAKLQVNPPQLGPIEVRIAVRGDHAQVWLTSHSAVTRDALESSSPKLREMLGAQGFGQVSVDISQRSFQDQAARSQSYDWAPATNRGTSTAPVSSAATSTARTASGVVDAYA